jgi:uncharacterized membrane protein
MITTTASTVRSRSLFRHLGPILAGLAVGIVLSLGTDTVMRAAGVFPPFPQPMNGARFLLATAYRAVFSVVGSYLAARLSSERGMRNALVLGVLGVIASGAGLVFAWNKGPEFGPLWYPVALIALSLPCAWLGGKLTSRRSA